MHVWIECHLCAWRQDGGMAVIMVMLVVMIVTVVTMVVIIVVLQ